MDDRGVQAWLDRYIDAWREGDATVIKELFARGAEYRYHPADEPLHGPEAIAASWLEDPDDPDSWDAWYRPYAVDGDRATASGMSTYFNPDGTVRQVFDNVFLLAFDASGRCTHFTEWFVARPPAQVDAPAPVGP